MAWECDNEETADIVEIEAADSDDKTKTVSSVCELIPAIMLFRHLTVFFCFKPTDNQVRDDLICRHCHLKTHVQPLHLILRNFSHST